MLNFLKDRYVAFALAMLLAGLVGVYAAGGALTRTQDDLLHAYTVREINQRIFIGLLDAETGQRGYLLTGDQTYLDSFTWGQRDVPTALAEYGTLALDKDEASFVAVITPLVNEKMAELTRTVRLRNETGFADARAAVMTNRGRETMSRLRVLFASERVRQKAQRVYLLEWRALMAQATFTALMLVFASLTLMWYAVNRR